MKTSVMEEREAHHLLLDEQRAQNARLYGGLRIVLGAIYVGLILFGAAMGRREYRMLIPVAMTFLIASVIVFAASRRTKRPIVFYAFFFIELPILFTGQLLACRIVADPLTIAAFTTSIFAATIAASMLSLRKRLVLSVAAVSMVLETTLIVVAKGAAPEVVTNVSVLLVLTLLAYWLIRQFDDRLHENALAVVRREEAMLQRLREVEALNEELRFQVEARSRELGNMLTRGDAPAQKSDLAVGSTFAARYKIEGLLGRGGMGAVYRVRRLSDQASFALKIMTGEVSSTDAARFAREAELAAKLRHPNLVPVVDVGIAPDGPLYLVMELVEGKSFEDSRDRFGEPAWALPIVIDIARALTVVHAAGIVHRDVKPSNVLLSSAGARLADFGVARPEIALGDTLHASDPKLTMTGAMIGTPMYMAPEIARRKPATRASDMFSFGLMALEALTGGFPLREPAFVATLANRKLELTPQPDGELYRHLMSLLAEDPAARPNATETLEILAR